MARLWRTLPALVLVMALQPVSTSSAQALPGSIKELKVASPEKDFPIRSVQVWTPEVPDDQISKLPVVYFLHGWPGTPNGMISATVSNLSAAFNEGADPFIAVFPDGNAKTHIDSEWADSYDKKAMVESWLTSNVISAVEGDSIRSRESRAILGFSMGGYGAASIALHHPELYSQVITLAGYFVVDDLTNAYGYPPNNKKKIAYQSPNNFLSTATKLRWFLGESPQDFTILIHGQAAQWSKKLKAKKAEYALSSPAGGHSYTFVAAEMKPIANWLKWN